MSKKSFKDNPALQFISSAEERVEQPGALALQPQQQTAKASPKNPASERRTRRVQLVLAPSVYERAMRAFESRGFRSFNDYICTLIENDTAEE